MLKSLRLGVALTIILISLQTGLRASANTPNLKVQQSSAATVSTDGSSKLSLFIAGSIVLFLAKNQFQARSPNTSRRQVSIKPQNKKLSRLCAGDRQVAERLLNHLRKKHPGQTEQWYVDKVVYDLERDRR